MTAACCRSACAARSTPKTISILRANTKSAWSPPKNFTKKEWRQVKRHLAAFKNKPTYVTLDIDCVDPAYAPGTGTPQVGGFTSHQILQLVRALRGLNIIGADLVEVSPPFDTGEITSLLAANLLYELLCVL